MSDHKPDRRWLKEFGAFVKGSAQPPAHLSQPLFAKIGADLNPSFWAVLLKLGTIQLSVGALTLLFCPQMGVGPVFGEHGLMYLFMHFGAGVCTAACAALFFGSSLLLGLFVIRPEELRVMRKTRLVYLPLLSTISLMLLMALGSNGPLLFYSLWLLGALLSGEVASLVASRARLA